MYAIYIFGAMFMRIAWRMRLLYPEKLCSTPKGSQLKRKSSSSFVYSNEVLCACIIVGGLCSKYRLFFFFAAQVHFLDSTEHTWKDVNPEQRSNDAFRFGSEFYNVVFFLCRI